MQDGTGAPAPKRLTVLHRLGSGDAGEVFLARQAGAAGFQKAVAAKRLRETLAHVPACVERFLEEARLAAKLSHPNLVQAFDLVQEEGTYSLVMELVDGRSLEALVRMSREKGRLLPAALVAHIAQQALHGLEHAHTLKDDEGRALAIVHRDLRAEDLLIGFNGAVKLKGFSLAPAQSLRTVLAPELMRGESPSVASDIFSMGALLHEALTGVRPADGRTTSVAPTSAQLPPIPGELSAIILRALSPAPDERQVSAAAFADELGAFVEDCGERMGSSYVAAYMRTVFHGMRRKSDLDAATR